MKRMICVSALCLWAAVSSAASLHPIFRDGMVFAVGKPVRVYGAGEGRVSVRFRGEVRATRGGADGWCVTFPAPAAAADGETLTVELDGRRIVLKDIRLGEVFLIAGQSNLRVRLNECTTSLEGWADEPRLRCYTQQRPEPSPFSPTNGWVGLKTAEAPVWSALTALFGRARLKSGAPAFGAVGCYQGASVIESWLPPEIASEPRFARSPEKLHGDHFHRIYGRWNAPGTLYRDMFRKIGPFSFSGVVWYQGESNTGPGEAENYAALLSELVSVWRRDLKDAELPFLVVQIADNDGRRDADWRNLQAAQAAAASRLPGVWLVRSADVCEAANIHPREKSRLAQRLSDTWDAQVRPMRETVAKIAKTHAVKGEDRFFGFRRVTFDFQGHDAWIVFPEGPVAEGRPWTWTMQWSTAFVPRTGVTQLLASGWHHVTIDTYRHRMDEEGLRVSAAFQKFLVDELGLAPQANLVGLSWGGFFSVRYAVAHPDCVRKIYLDAPLLVYRPGRNNDIGTWADRCPADGDWMPDPEMPVNKAEALAKTGIPVLMLYGAHDQEVRPETNAELFEKRFRAAGGDLKVFCRPAYGHHPHGVEESEPTIRNFFMAKKGEDWAPGIRDAFSAQIR